jgi:hypothetical protein
MKKRIFLIFSLIMIISMLTSSVLAEDGKLFRRNISKTPDGETEKAAVYMMDFYVPAQASTGLVGPVTNYLLADETVSVDYGERYYAKPLISVYIDEIGADVISFDEEESLLSINGGIVLGAFDAFVGVSLDDGTSWKTSNLSRSADLSSFTPSAPGINQGVPYPGGVHNVVHQVFGDNIMVAWVSKYCDGGTPLYALDPTEDADYLDDLELNYAKDAVYLYDLFGVGGNQKSVDYTLQGHPDVGEIPYSCVWTARGKLLAGDDPATTETEATYVVWTKPERLTSGRRDANLPAVDCAAGAGCMLTWQEDPDGLRPGLGLGPGEGWSGAVAWQQTDIWYSHISQVDFDKVFEAEDTIGAITLAEYADATMPKSYVPMAMPVRLTDNAMCKAANDDPYCYIDFDNIDAIDPLALPTAPTADSDFCATQVSWLNPGGTTLNLCVTEDNRLLNGRVASTRVRMNLKPYSTGVTNDNGTPDDTTDDFEEKSAWIVMAAEESKALGDTAEDEDDDPIDIGKNMWYYSFDPFKTGADEFMVSQGGMLNQPAVCKDTEDDFCTAGVGEFYDIQVDGRDNEFYLTEISRRFALTTNSVQAAIDSDSGLSAMLIYKQGIINQGGPADIMLRRLVIPDDFDPTVDNPYAYENMDCDEWAYIDGNNPNYLQGVCLSPAINITANTIVRCDIGTGNDTCADAFPIADDGSNPTGTAVPKVFEWRQCDGSLAIEGCEDDNDLDDQVWENPYDVAKGHRGFLDGDIVMIMYAWAPNWNANSVGNDHYNLYVRRSFDGGFTWTTTPASLGGEGVTVTEYYYGTSVGDPVPVEWTYDAGEYEQGRNVSLLTGNKVTILDPRYSPTGGVKLYPTIRTDWLTTNNISFEGLPYEDDAVRDPSKFFMVYETGDNTTVAVGEATPLDLYYSRATVYGDVYEVMDYKTDTDDLVLDRWPWLENKTDILSGEASMLANPGGTFMYAVWNQWEEDILPDGEELIFNSDIIFRRMLYLPDDSTEQTIPYTELIYTNGKVFDDSMDILLVASARDFDKLGDVEIVEYEWSVDGVVQEDVTGKMYNAPARNLAKGWHGFSVRANDAEGSWSNVVSYELYVLTGTNKVFIPLVIK